MGVCANRPVSGVAVKRRPRLGKNHRQGKALPGRERAARGNSLKGEVVKCPECGARNMSTLDVCGACGADLEAESIEDSHVDPWDRVLGRSGESLNAKAKTSGNRPSSRPRAVLTFVVGPAVTVSMFFLVVGALWSRELSKNPQASESYLFDLNLAGDMTFYGLVAFAILVVVALAILSEQIER
jgi:hypothetical protein